MTAGLAKSAHLLYPHRHPTPLPMARMTSSSSRTRATLIGLSAVAMWSMLGLLATAAEGVPPILMTALCFLISGLGSMGWLIVTGRIRRLAGLPPKAWALGIGGLAGFHVLYFIAMSLAPPIEANLLNYTWPLLIVLFSGLLPGERLKSHHLAGVVLGFAGAALLILRSSGGLSLAGTAPLGFLAAAASAVTWAGYSVLSRRLPEVPTEAVAAFCLASGLITGALHFALEPTILPQSLSAWGAILALGALPIGLAFFVWDYGVKHGDIQILGAGSYAAPLASTLLLAAFGKGQFSTIVALAALAITAGAVIAAKDMLLRKKR